MAVPTATSVKECIPQYRRPNMMVVPYQSKIARLVLYTTGEEKEEVGSAAALRKRA